MAENVKNLQDKLEAMSTPHRKTGKTNLWDVAVSINRTNAVPLDKSSVIFDGTPIAEAANSATAYPGQIISSLHNTDGKVYALQPTGHEHKTHIADAGSEKTYTDQTTVEKKVFEELAPLSTVEYEVNKEAYKRQVANNARINTEQQIAEFILESSKNAEIVEDGSISLSLPDTISDSTATTDTTATTVLDYIIATVAAEKRVRTDSDTVLAQYIGTANPSHTDKDGLLSGELTLPATKSDGTARGASTVLGFVEETVQAEKAVRVQATKDLAAYIGTEIAIADTGSTILTGLSLPETLSDQTATPDNITTLLKYIEATVEAEVQKRYEQDSALLGEINALDLHRAISISATDNIAEDGYLTIDLKTTLRDSQNNSPLSMYNN